MSSKERMKTMSRRDKMIKKSKSGSGSSSIPSFASDDVLDDSHRSIKKIELNDPKPHSADFVSSISQVEYANGAQLETVVAVTTKGESRTRTETSTAKSISARTRRSCDTSLSSLSEDEKDSCSSSSGQLTTLRACTKVEQSKHSNRFEKGHRDEANTTECEFTAYPRLGDTHLHQEQEPRKICNQIVVIEPPSLPISLMSTRNIESHSISNYNSKPSLHSLAIPKYHYDEDSYTQSSSSYSSSLFVPKKTFKERLFRLRPQHPRKNPKKEEKALKTLRKIPSFQCYLRNDASIKSCLKQSPFSCGDANNGSGDDHHVSFGTIEIREYERTIGDNPSCTSGPPLAIGWRFVPDTDIVTTEDRESLPANASTAIIANHRTVDQYEMQRQDQRRSGIDLKLSSGYREDLLRDEWDITPRVMRMAQYEVRQVQQQRIDSYHYCYLEKVQFLVEIIRKLIKRRHRKEQEKMLKDILEYSQSKSVSTLKTTQEEEDEEFAFDK